MTATRGCGCMVPMTTLEPRTLTLLLDGAPSGPLTGAVVDEHGRRLPFEGWLGLAQALETQLAAPSDHPAQTGSAR